ncbi:LysR family transcriptional regulator [Psychromicrobium lacuslunae]|uniref:LysR family transcriptional regulator n=1 Tax=Psychromicrobium lacuslunae TaxID=1618207 RepID=A0A0D4BZU5_9MICC|nr:LysR family transcriptional regulator [Psychromicrobium lacuslunae]AJT41616.1 LysR family transcriptional regulator [Psychromicrobium lacuslunae]
MEFRQLRTFEAIIREGSISGAALALDRAPSSVSEQLRGLEQSLGVALFERQSRGMKLTGAGERLATWSGRLLAQLDEARREVLGAPIHVTLAALETVMAVHAPRVLKSLSARRPGVQVRTVPMNNRIDLLRSISEGEVDAGLLFDLDGELGGLGFEVPSEGFSYLDLEPVQLSLLAAPNHQLAQREGLRPADLLPYSMIGNNPLCSFWLAAERMLPEQTRRLAAGSVAIAKAWTAQGDGFTLLPDFAVGPELAARELIRLPLQVLPLELRLVWSAEREGQPGVRDLLYAIADPVRA